MRILIAPDKFKGSLTAAQAALAIALGWRTGFPAGAELEIDCLPIADGGEGTAEVVCAALDGHWITRRVHDPIGREIDARYALVEHAGERVAVIEMSSASGFTLVQGADRDLLRANTFGTGELLTHALQQPGVSRAIIGIGGSATNDGGIGLAAALGYRFLNGRGEPIDPTPGAMADLAEIIPPLEALPAAAIDVACDVTNPLLGPSGATTVYGPQKGLSDTDELQRLETGLERLADVAARTFGRDHRAAPGAGAAGGLGFGLLTFCDARLQPGFGLIADLLGIPERIRQADLVITGEGSLDAQTLEGKGPAGIAALARAAGKPVIAICGRTDETARAQLLCAFDEIIALASLEPALSAADCMARGAEMLNCHVADFARRFGS